MTHVSSGVLNRRGTACALEAESDWRTSKRSRRSHRRSVPASLSGAKIVLQSAEVEFIDDNGGGPGGRLKQAKRETRKKQLGGGQRPRPDWCRRICRTDQ